MLIILLNPINNLYFPLPHITISQKSCIKQEKKMLARVYLQSFKRVFTNGSCSKAGFNLTTHCSGYHTLNSKSIPTLAKCETVANNGHNILPMHLNIATRGFKNPKAPRGLKTKQCAAKRFIKTGSGIVPYDFVTGVIAFLIYENWLSWFR